MHISFRYHLKVYYCQPKGKLNKDFHPNGVTNRNVIMFFMQVFQKGSPIAADISKAILQLMEDGTLKRLEEEWLTPSAECRNSQTDKNIDVLSFQSFWGLYLFSIATSSICFLLFLAKLLKSFYHDHESGGIHGSDDSVWNKTVRLGRYLYKADTGNPRRAPTSSRATPHIGNTIRLSKFKKRKNRENVHLLFILDAER